LIILVIMISYMIREARTVVLETVRLAEDADALRVVQISDIHIRYRTVRLDKIIEIIKGANPHIIILTGDYICTAKEAERFLPWLRELRESFGGIGFYLCFGNHDHRAFRKFPEIKKDFVRDIKKLGIYIMENKTATFSLNDKIYAITGFSDVYTTPRYNIHNAFKGAPKETHYHIGFTHNPDLAVDLKTRRPHILLCGHFHGGQIRLPFHLEYTCLRKELLCKMGIRSGLREFGGRHIYISRGVGCVFIPLRFLAKPEVTLFILP